MDDHREPPLRGVTAEHRGELVGMDQGMRVLSYLIAGVGVYGALGWLGDHFLGTAFLLPIGIVLGAAGGCYVIIRRYGQFSAPPGASPGANDAGSATGDPRDAGAIDASPTTASPTNAAMTDGTGTDTKVEETR